MNGIKLDRSYVLNRDLLNCLCDKLHKIFYQDKQDEALQCIRVCNYTNA